MLPNFLSQFLFLVFLVGLVSPANAADTEEYDWVEVTSPNFVLYSNQKSGRALELINSLETFRAAVTSITTIETKKSSIPTKTFVFRDRKGFRRTTGFNKNFAGFFRTGLRNNTIAMRETDGSEIDLILHEYVHFLVRNQNQLNYPKWFDEGFAEYLSSTKETKGALRIGEPDRGRIQWLSSHSWLPFERQWLKRFRCSKTSRTESRPRARDRPGSRRGAA